MEIVEIKDDRDGVDGDAECYVVVELRIVGYPTRAREVCKVFIATRNGSCNIECFTFRRSACRPARPPTARPPTVPNGSDFISGKR